MTRREAEFFLEAAMALTVQRMYPMPLGIILFMRDWLNRNMVGPCPLTTGEIMMVQDAARRLLPDFELCELVESVSHDPA